MKLWPYRAGMIAFVRRHSRILLLAAAILVAAGAGMFYLLGPYPLGLGPRDAMLRFMPPDMRYVLYLRTESITRIPLVRRVLQTMQAGDAGPWWKDPLNETRRRLGLDFEKDIKWICLGVTPDGIPLGLASGNTYRLRGVLAAVPELREARVGDLQAYIGDEISLIVINSQFLGIARDARGLEQLVMVRRGEGPSLDSNEGMARLVAGFEKGHLVWGGGLIDPAAAGPALSGNPMWSDVNLARSFSYQGDCDDNLSLVVKLDCIDNVSAQKVSSSLAQVVELARVFGYKEPELVAVLNGVTVTVEGPAAGLTAKVPGDAVVAAVAKYRNRIESNFSPATENR
ncbi:MAG: hypothetical protein AB1714_25720 [Acidobacteriota bacterium]